MSLAELKRDRVAQVMRQRALRLQRGTRVAALGNALIPTDAHTLVIMVWAREYFALNPGSDFEWPTGDGVWVTIDQAKLNQAALGVIAFLRACNARARQLQTAIEAAVDEAAVRTILVHTGWPA